MVDTGAHGSQIELGNFLQKTILRFEDHSQGVSAHL